MGRYKIEYTEVADRHLNTIKRRDGDYLSKIIDKIDFCLGEHLFGHIQQCDKKKLKGKKNTYRLHVQRKYTVFYTISDVEQNKSVVVHMVMDYKTAHKRYSHRDL